VQDPTVVDAYEVMVVTKDIVSVCTTLFTQSVSVTVLIRLGSAVGAAVLGLLVELGKNTR
jgi:hypothetical protein